MYQENKYNTYNDVINDKIVEINEEITSKIPNDNKLLKSAVSLLLLNPIKTVEYISTAANALGTVVNTVGLNIGALIQMKQVPVLKKYEICYLTESNINHLYLAFDWYLKTISKKPKAENHVMVYMMKPIEKSKVDKEYPIMRSVPEHHHSEFEYEDSHFNYVKTSFDDFIYGMAGEVKKKNYMITIQTFDCDDKKFDKLSNYVSCEFARSKIEEVWVQKYYSHENGKWKETIMEKNRRKISTVIMKDNKNLEIEKSLNHFFKTEDWHLERGMPYKKSYLFYGPPGTGKSSMIKAISYQFQKHIHNINLSTIADDIEFEKLTKSIIYSETILVLEDIDSQSNSVIERSTKENNNENKGVTLSAILNFIDGIMNSHSRILIMTTNYPQKLDQALIRDGRIDESILFGYCDIQQIKKMFDNFYDIDVDIELLETYIPKESSIAPCTVEKSIRKHYNNHFHALDDINKNIIGGNKLEDFTM